MKNERRLRIMTAEGELRGLMDDELFIFKGIPYAAPPVGALRWRPPQPVVPWQTLRDATAWGDASWQNRDYCVAAGGGDPGRFSEDCLYLNVWTPDVEPATPLPVMVWLHGGGFSIGAGSLDPYRGKALAAQGVVVTLNYRLTISAFLRIRRSTPSIRRARWSIILRCWIRLPRCSGFSVTSRHLAATAITSRCLANRPARAAYCRCAARRWPKGCFIRVLCKVPTVCRTCRISRRSKPACRWQRISIWPRMPVRSSCAHCRPTVSGRWSDRWRSGRYYQRRCGATQTHARHLYGG